MAFSEEIESSFAWAPAPSFAAEAEASFDFTPGHAFGEEIEATFAWPVIIEPTAAPSGETFGTPSIVHALGPVAIPSSEIVNAPVIIIPIGPSVGIPSGQVGSPAIASLIEITTFGDGSAVGAPFIAIALIAPPSMLSEEVVGNPSLSAVFPSALLVQNADVTAPTAVRNRIRPQPASTLSPGAVPMETDPRTGFSGGFRA